MSESAVRFLIAVGLNIVAGGAYVPTPFVGMYAPLAPIPATTWPRHARRRHVCATRDPYEAL